MFDLFRSRAKAVRYLLGALLLLVAASMLTYLVPNYGGGQSGTGNVLAEVGDEQISVREVQLTLQNMQRGRSVSPEMMRVFVPQLVEQMVTERALVFQAKRLGYQVGEDDIAETIRQMVPQLFPEGKFAGNDVYNAMVTQQNMTVPEFERNIARQVYMQRIRNVALQGVVVSQAEIEQEYRRKNEKVAVDFVRVPREKYERDVQVSEQEMRDYYNRHRAEYQAPESRALQLLVFDQGQIQESLVVTDDDLRKIYASDRDRFRNQERVRVRHILLKTTGKAKEEDAKMRAQAEDLLKKIKGGADFAELAKKYSEDPGSGSKGGDLGWIVRQQTVKEFEQAAFSLEPKQLSGLIKTEYGYHIIQVLEKQQAGVRPFEEVKGEIAASFRQQRIVELTQSLSDKAYAALRNNSKNAAGIAAELKVPLVTIAKAGPGDPLPEIGVNPDFETAVAALRKGEFTTPLPVSATKMVIAVVTDVIPAHASTFEEVQAKVRLSLTVEKTEKLLEQKASELAAKVQSANGDLKAAAKAMGLDVKSAPPSTRAGSIEGLGSAESIPDLFSKPVGSVIGPVSVSGTRVVLKVTDHSMPDASQIGMSTAILRDEVKTRKVRVRNSLFEDGLREQLIREGKIKIYQDVMNRLVAGSRG